MKKKLLILLPIILALVACAGVQEKWNKLTPDEKARIIIGDFQGQLDNLFDQGKAYVVAHPDKQELWKTKAIPAFSVANQSLASVITLGKTKPLTPDQVYAVVQANVNAVVTLLTQMGVIK